MICVTPTAISHSARRSWLGTILCLLAAIGYTGANICLRQLAEMKADPAWVICLKETIAVLVYGPWLLWRYGRAMRLARCHQAVLVLILISLATQLIGNLGLQWSLGVVGLVVSLPVVSAASLFGSALIGLTLFRESLHARLLVAVATVIASIVLLSVGAGSSRGAMTSGSGAMLTALAIAVTAAAGTTYAALAAALRHAANARLPVPVSVVVVTGTGSLILGTLCLIRLGPAEMLATEPTVLAWVTASGLCNVVAFSLITKGIQLTTLVHANALNASQVGLGALAGILLFHEPYNGWLLGGVALTIVGIVSFGRPRRLVTHHA